MSLRIYTVKAGKHDFWPKEARTPHLSRGLSWTWDVVFDATCRYSLPGEDQKDYNKGGGVSMELLSNNRNSIMWAWRYNPKNDCIQLATYVNCRGKSEIGDGVNIVQMQVAIAERCRIELTRLAGELWQMRFIRLDINNNPVDSVTTFPAIKTPVFVYRLGLWFGGNNPAPNDMQVWVDLKR